MGKHHKTAIKNSSETKIVNISDKHKHDSDSEKESIIDDVTDSEVEDKKDDDSESNVSFSTTEILSNDPLYFILSRLFITENGKNLATILEEINQKLGKLTETSSSILRRLK